MTPCPSVLVSLDCEFPAVLPRQHYNYVAMTSRRVTLCFTSTIKCNAGIGFQIMAVCRSVWAMFFRRYLPGEAASISRWELPTLSSVNCLFPHLESKRSGPLLSHLACQPTKTPTKHHWWQENISTFPGLQRKKDPGVVIHTCIPST